MYLLNGIRMEFFKLKRTGIHWFIYVIPALFTLLSGILYLWSKNITFDNLRIVTFQMFLTFIYPLLIGVITALIIRMERRDNGINNLLVIPIPKSQVFLNKIGLLIFINLYMVLTIYVVLTIYTLIFNPSGYSFVGEIPNFICIWLSGCLISSIQLLLSFKFSGVLIPISVCTILTFSGLFVGASKYAMFHFWTYPILSIYNGYNKPLIGIISLLMIGLLTLLGMYLFSHKWTNQAGKQ